MKYEFPWYVKYVAFLLVAVVLYALGMLHGERVAGQVHIDYLAAQGRRSVAIAAAQTKVVVQTEIQYRDRIQKIYVKGDVIEKQIPVYVTRVDDAACSVNAGFVRTYNASWSGEDPGAAAESDRESAGVPLSELAETDAHNATSCRAWREQALGWREYYRKLKVQTDSAD